MSSSKDMAYIIGTQRLEEPDGNVTHGRYCAIWTKVDGEWKAKFGMNNLDGEKSYQIL